jgi:hypothetical protein
MAVKRIWRGWTTPENAATYQALLNQKIRPEIEAKEISGYRCLELHSRNLKTEVEFMTIMTFDSLQNVVDFAGEPCEQCYVPAAAQAVLSRWDKVCLHYETLDPSNDFGTD